MKFRKPRFAQLQIRYSVRNIILIGTFSTLSKRKRNETRRNDGCRMYYISVGVYERFKIIV